IEHADQAMYQAKQRGRNHVCTAEREWASGRSEQQTREVMVAQALTAAAAAHDSAIEAHAQRLVRLAETTARHLGQSEKEIHLGARVLTVVDAYDAMTAHRAYRNPLSTAQARRELQRCAGSQFDPCVVEVFLGVLEE